MGLPIITPNSASLVGIVTPEGNVNAVALASSFGDGSSGSVSAGLGLYAITNAGTITLGNTGTISLPSQTGTNNGNGIKLQAGSPGPSGTSAGNLYLYGAPGFTTDAAGSVYGSKIRIAGYDVTAANASTLVQGSYVQMVSGNVSNGVSVVAKGAQFSVAAAQINYGTASGGDVFFSGGNADGIGGSITFVVGTGASNGVLGVTNLSTGDPHVAGAIFQSATANAAGNFPLYISQG